MHPPYEEEPEAKSNMRCSRSHGEVIVSVTQEPGVIHLQVRDTTRVRHHGHTVRGSTMAMLQEDDLLSYLGGNA